MALPGGAPGCGGGPTVRHGRADGPHPGRPRAPAGGPGRRAPARPLHAGRLGEALRLGPQLRRRGREAGAHAVRADVAGC